MNKRIITVTDDFKRGAVAFGEPVGYYMPTREEVEGLKVGDLAPDCFGRWRTVQSIHAQTDDMRGRAFVCYVTASPSGNGGTSNSLKEAELLRSLEVTRLHTSAECDRIEAAMRVEVARALGAAAFAAGKTRTPALDASWQYLIKGQPVGGQTLGILDGWLGGWDAANLAAPVEV